MEKYEVARFEHAGDVRRMMVVQDGERVTFREDISGPSTVISYGEHARSLRVTFEPEALSLLLARVGFSGEKGLWTYLSCESFDILDLMDLCDREKIPYTFVSLGPRGDVQFHPAVSA